MRCQLIPISLIPPPPKTEDEILAEENIKKTAINNSTKTAPTATAIEKISALHDTSDLGMATAEEAAALPLCKKYRVLLCRVDAHTSDDIACPEAPSF
ncbi:tail fiber assembly protein [Rahnella aceris]|uniref:tail fiber assembly protein n=1 Tax=Rahnella sp. (strain Y9602) TaxID=2703885 RepID=UPI0009007389|nr:tail fiber assembly protein [Rahnella aceris]